MSEGATGVGAELQIGDGNSPEGFTKISEVTTIEGPNLSIELVEATSLDSPGGFKEYKPGLKDGGEVTFDANFVPTNAQQQQLRTLISAAQQAATNFRIVWPFSPEPRVTFAGLVQNYGMSTEPNGMVTISGSLKLTSLPTWENA